MIAELISLTVAAFRVWRETYGASRAWEAPRVLRRLKLFGAWHRT